MTPRYTIFVPHASETFTDHLPHGDGLVAFEVASRLAARGHCVHVMAPTIDVRGTLPGSLHLHFLRKPLASGWRGTASYLSQVRSTYAGLRRQNRFDLIHQLNPVHAGISLALWDARVPVVLGSYVAPWPRDADSRGVTGASALPFAATIRRATTALQQRLATAIILTTPAAEAQLVERKRSRKKAQVIPHGIDPEPYRPPAGESTAGESPVVLFLGGTERRKGIYVLLEAFAMVRRALPRARLLIAGAGGREHEVAAVVESMPERSSIELLGVVERSDVPALMHRATVFAAPSYAEPFGMSLLEAMASGKPVVVTDAGGPAHIVDPAGGLRVPVGDAAALANAILAILQAPDLVKEMGRYNRAKAESVYAWDRVIDGIEDVYARAIAGGRT